MAGKLKKLSIAFYWNFYQPCYGIKPENDYIMPWSRLYAVKDYLSTILIAEKFRNIKINLNISPTLIDDFEKYGEKNFHDIYSRLTLKDENSFTDDEKKFILDNFFDVNFEKMILPNKNYLLLAQKLQKNPDINEFSRQEYADLTALFNLVWINPLHYKQYPEIKKLLAKGKNYTLEDREKIIQIQRNIIKRIIPEMKKLLKSGRLELTVSPYYHPVIPVLLDINDVIAGNKENLPLISNMKNTAKKQITSAFSKFYEVFNEIPKSIWLPELAISDKTVKLLAELGIKQVVADESCFINSAKEILTRDFNGNYENPYPILKTYNYKTQNGDIRLIFRDALFPYIINYEYPQINARNSANDFYDRIKIIQSKIQNSPDETHLLTLAMDGENYRDNYDDYGNSFLEKIYKYIASDNSLETVLLSNYTQKDNHIKPLERIKAGNSTSADFKSWVDEPAKNKAWEYLQKTYEDFEAFAQENPQSDLLENAYREILIAQASDWFWWYGEPNHSPHENIYDFMFRSHLKNVYELLNLEIPNFLDNPIV